MARVEIDRESGFCFGVVTAINKAEMELARAHEDGSPDKEPEALYCLGDIVHNSDEVERLERRGLRTINHDDLARLRDAKVLLRAHGEPPSTYETARRNNIEIIDATCPVVLQLQRRIKEAYDAAREAGGPMPLILIYGKPGHAEVNGLVGQTGGEAVVVQSVDEVEALELPEDREVLLYSQTTKSLDGFRRIVEAIKARNPKGGFRYFDTICRQVANRMEGIRRFAASHDAIIFVSGKKSSNGRVLFAACREVNPRSYIISSPAELTSAMTEGAGSIGICGATSTPAWLMEEVRKMLNVEC